MSLYERLSRDLTDEERQTRGSHIFVGHQSRDADLRRAIRDIFHPPHLRAYFARESTSSGDILFKICRKIWLSRGGIIDLTTENPNIYLELGIAIGMNKPTLIVHKSTTTLPPWLSGFPGIPFTEYQDLRDSLSKPEITNKFEVDYETNRPCSEPCAFSNISCDFRCGATLENTGFIVDECYDDNDRKKLAASGDLQRSLKSRFPDINLVLLTQLEHRKPLEFCNYCCHLRESGFVIGHLESRSNAPKVCLLLGLAIGLGIPWALLTHKERDVQIPTVLLGQDNAILFNSYVEDIKEKPDNLQFLIDESNTIHNTVKKALTLAQKAEANGKHKEAADTLSGVQKRYPYRSQIDKAVRHVQDELIARHQKRERHLKQARTLSQELSFIQAVEFYEAAHEVDPDDHTADYEGETQARENAHKLQQIERQIERTYEELSRHNLPVAQQCFDQALKLDNHQWRTAELDNLKQQLDDQEVDRDFTTLSALLAQGGIKWPQDVEQWFNENTNISYFASQEETFRKEFLQQHYEFLGAELAAVDQPWDKIDPSDCIDRLRQIQRAWAPIQRKTPAYNKWPQIPLFDSVLYRVQRAIELLHRYEDVNILAQEIDATVQFVSNRQDENTYFEQALDKIASCVTRRPTIGIGDEILGSRYTNLAKLETELRRAWSAKQQDLLFRAEILIEGCEYTKTQDILEQIPPKSLVSLDQERLDILRKKVELGIQAEELFAEAEALWHAGEWEKAKLCFVQYAELVSQDHYRSQLAQTRIADADVIYAFDQERLSLLAQMPYTDERIQEADELFENLSRWESSNRCLKAQSESWQGQRIVWLQHNAAKRIAQDALKQGNWRTAEQLLRNALSEVDPEIGGLQELIERVQQAPSVIKEADTLTEQGLNADGLNEVLHYLKEARDLYEKVNTLELQSPDGIEAKYKAQQLTQMQNDVESMSTLDAKAETAEAQGHYQEALDALREACGLADTISHPKLYTYFMQRCERLERLV